MIGHNSYRNQNIIRSNPEHDFTVLSNAMLQDSRLSYESRGLLAELLSRPDDWEISVANIAKSGPAGRDKVYRMLRELEDAHYAKREAERRMSGSFQKHRYVVSDDPQLLIERAAAELLEMEKKPLPEDTEVVVPFPGKAEVVRKDKMAETGHLLPLPENAEVDEPLPGNPLTAQPLPANTEAYKEKTLTKNLKDKGEREDARVLGSHSESRLPENWFLPKEWGQWATHECKRDEHWVRDQADKFRDYWLSVPDSKGFKKNWRATWQNWCRNSLQREAKFNGGRPFAPKTQVKSWRDREQESSDARYLDSIVRPKVKPRPKEEDELYG